MAFLARDYKELFIEVSHCIYTHKVAGFSEVPEQLNTGFFWNECVLCKEAEESHATVLCFPSVLTKLKVFPLRIEWNYI